MDPLRLLIIAADPLGRLGLAAIFEHQDGCLVVGQVAGLADLPAALDLYRPDVGLVDLGVDFGLNPGGNEAEVGLPLVYLVPGEGRGSSGENRKTRDENRELNKAGRAFLGRDTRPEVIVHVFHAVMNGLLVQDARIEDREAGPRQDFEAPRIEKREPGNESRELKFESRFKSPTLPAAGTDGIITAIDDFRISNLDSPTYEPLTWRELEVLSLIAEGLPNKGVAQRLGISEHTVKYHINAILGKLGAESRTEAVTRAARLGWLIL